MSFEDELAALLEQNTVFQPSYMDVGESPGFTGNIGDYDPGFEAGAFSGMVFDRERNELISFEEAMRRDPVAASDVLRDRQLGLADDRLGAGTGTGSPDVVPPPAPGGLAGLLAGIKNNRDLIGLMLTGGGLALGLGSAIAGLTSKDSAGGSAIKLPDGRTLTLTPQETQLLDLAVNQAQAQAGIHARTVGAMDTALGENPDALKNLYGGALRTATSQMGGTERMSGVANDLLFGPAAGDPKGLLAKYQNDPKLGLVLGVGTQPGGWADSGWSAETIRANLLAIPGMAAEDAAAIATYLAGVSPSEANTLYQAFESKTLAAAPGAPDAKTILSNDLANTGKLQAAQGTAATNLSDFLDTEAPAAEKLSTDVGMAADRMVLDRMDPGKPLDPSYEALRPLGTQAIDTVGRYIGGETDIPDAYAGEDLVRRTANDVITRGLDGSAGADPWLETRISRARDGLVAKIQQDLGPGGEYSTPGMKRLEEFELQASQALTQNRREQVSLASGVAMPRSSFIEGVASGRAGAAAPYVFGVPNTLQKARLDDISTYAPIGVSRAAFAEGATQNRFARNAAVADDIGKGTRNIGDIFSLGQSGAPTPSGTVGAITSQQPGSVALGAFGAASGVSNTQAATANQTAIMNALIAAQKRNQLVQGGGQMIGNAITPFLSAASTSLFK